MTDEIPAHVPPSLVYDFDYVRAPVDTQEPHREICRQLQANAPPIFYTPRNGGHWVVQKPSSTVEMFRRTEDFSSDPKHNPTRAWKPRMLPNQADPPDHMQYRKVLGAFFSPVSMRRIEGDIRAICADILDGVTERGSCEFIADIAEMFPIRVFMRLVNAPLSDREKLIELAQLFTRSAELGPRAQAVAGLAAYNQRLYDQRRQNPGDDVLSQFLKSDFNGRPLTDDELQGMGALIFLAGLDTLRSALSFIMLYLARNPAQYQKLRGNPSLIPNAVEELLRVAGTSSPERAAARDVTFEGVEMKAGDRIVYMLPLFAYTDELNVNPELIDFEREAPQHLIFGSGPHRCAGSHLARIEIKVFLEEWIKRIPAFAIDPTREVAMAASALWTPRQVPLVWPTADTRGKAA